MKLKSVCLLLASEIRLVAVAAWVALFLYPRMTISVATRRISDHPFFVHEKNDWFKTKEEYTFLVMCNHACWMPVYILVWSSVLRENVYESYHWQGSERFRPLPCHHVQGFWVINGAFVIVGLYISQPQVTRPDIGNIDCIPYSCKSLFALTRELGRKRRRQSDHNQEDSRFKFWMALKVSIS